MAIIKVVCGVIFNNGKVFICRRKQEKALGGFWEFPGGKIEDGENEFESLFRELLEELGMKVHVRHHLKTVIHHYDNISIELIAFVCDFIEASYILTDHDDFIWLDIAEIKRYNLAPADIPIAEELVTNNIS